MCEREREVGREEGGREGGREGLKEGGVQDNYSGTVEW